MKHTRALIFLAASIISVAMFLTTFLYCARLIDAIYGMHVPKYQIMRLR